MRYTTSKLESQIPVWMSPEETAEPRELISEFCRSWDLADCRFYLWQMLRNSVSYRYHDLEASPGAQMYFFEELIAMVEAVYLFHQSINNTPADQTGTTGLHLDQSLTDQLVKTIVGTVPTDAIFRLDNSHVGTSELIVFIENKERTSISTIPDRLRKSLSTMPPVTINIFNSDDFKSSVKHQTESLYFPLVLNDSKLVYLKDGQTFFVPPLPEKFPGRLRVMFESFFRKAKYFHHVADTYLKKAEHQPTVFFCHQASELSLTALLDTLTGSMDSNHTITEKLRWTRLLNPLLSQDLFGTELFNLLEQNPIQSRFSDAVKVSERQAIALVEKTGQLLNLIAKTFESITTKFGGSTDST